MRLLDPADVGTFQRARAAARYIGVSVLMLEHLRCTGAVSAQQVTLRRAMYAEDDLDAYLVRASEHRTITVGRETITIIYDEETL